MAALTGGGFYAKPGEVSLAHHGVLFLDELPEFSMQALDSLRQPIETGEVSVALWALDETDSVYVHTADSDGTWADHAFSLVVHC